MGITENELHQAAVTELLALKNLPDTSDIVRRKINSELTHRNDLPVSEFEQVHQPPECQIQRVQTQLQPKETTVLGQESMMVRLRCATHAVFSQPLK